MNDIRTDLKNMDRYNRKLRMRRSLATGVKIISGLILAVSIVTLLLVVSTSDYHSEAHYIPTEYEQHIQNMMFLLGAVGAVISGLLLLFMNRINAFIDHELERMRRVRRNRMKKEISRKQAMRDNIFNLSEIK